jgi:small subunit ribosomal protein S2
MPVVTTRQLLEAGVHFGHQTRRWNPKMKRFIFTERNGIYILDLQETVQGIERAYTFTRDLIAGGGTILFIATKKQLQDSVADQAQRCGMPYVNFRWLGGMLTNFRTMHARIQRMRELGDMIETGAMASFPKKEALKLQREFEKLERNLGGLKDLDKAPDAVFVLDTKKEEIAVREAKKLGIPVVAILDTNSDPDDADYGIPGNDDAIRSGALLARIIADGVIEGRSLRPHQEERAEAAATEAKQPGAEVLQTAAAEPKAEWELQLEAEEAATKIEEPKAEEPKAEEPKAEEPAAEESKPEEPKAEEPAAEESQVENESK